MSRTPVALAMRGSIDQYEKFLFGIQDDFGFVVDWKEFQKEKDEFDNTWRVNDFGWIYMVTLNDDTDWGY